MVIGIIAEYNPMHNGHVYQIKYAKDVLKADSVVVIMSGSFTQNGNISLIDKFNKANIAVLNDADLVIELPTIYATSSSENFAKGAIKLLNSLNIVDNILFGSECEDISILKDISNKLLDNKEAIDKEILLQDKNIPYAKARANVLINYLNSTEMNQINKPNNILAIQYITNLLILNSSISPISMSRIDGISSTIIRDSLTIDNYTYLNENAPQQVYNKLTDTKIYSNNIYLDKMYELIRYTLLFKDPNYLNNIYEIAEGLENKVLNEITTNTNYNDFLNSIKSKRYTLARIKRILINILLNISKSFYDEKLLTTDVYAHILKTNTKGKLLLSNISNNSNIPIITSYKENHLNKLELNNNILDLINLDILASNIHSTIFNNNINTDFTNQI